MPTSVPLAGLHPTLMRPRVEAFLADPDARALGIYVRSAFRSDAEQRLLWDRKVTEVRRAHPTWTQGQVEHEAANWVARPGRSNHGPRVDGAGTAIDLGIPGVWADSKGRWPDHIRNTVDAIAGRHGLHSPMPWEDWHYEPIPNWTSPVAATQEDDMAISEPVPIMINAGETRGYSVVPIRLVQVRSLLARVEHAGAMKGVVPRFGVEWEAAKDGSAIIWGEIDDAPLVAVKVHAHVVYAP
jgi:hypothetical protein